MDFSSAVGRDVGAVGSYEWGGLGSSLPILGGCWEDADSRATVDQKPYSRVLVSEV